ncbi:MAG: sigma-70 family RNA polymerase sigma factor [Clostridia bacterium]|nr:sigma-70 family RNA polymerase sigma factor [Clostridia bacterium]
MGENNDIFYICNGTDILPEKLTIEEENALVQKLSAGEPDASEARCELIERNLRLVVFTAGKFENTKLNMEDLISVGTIGLIKAVSSFKGDKNIKMATYASRCIENEILMYLRKTGKEKREVSLDEPLSSDSEGNELQIADILGTDSDIVSRRVDNDEEKSMLRLALAELPEREQQIMDMRYGLTNQKEMTQKEVADQLEISQSYISRLEKKIMSKLKKEISKFA